MRKLAHQGVREAEVADTPVRRLAPGECHLRRHSLADPPLRHARVPLGLARGLVERHCHPGLRGGRSRSTRSAPVQPVPSTRVSARMNDRTSVAAAHSLMCSILVTSRRWSKIPGHLRTSGSRLSPPLCHRELVTTAPNLSLTGVVLGSKDPSGLAAFYERLLGYERTTDEPDWVMLAPPGGGVGLSFQREEFHSPATWPAGPTDQQMQVHLDIEVGDLDAAGALAREAGATLADFQPQEHVRVWLDPAGHPFCLFRES